MGRAVYDSGLPTNIGMKLYNELSKAVAGLVLGKPLHLMYTIMLEHPFKIFGWGCWGKLFENLPSMQKKVNAPLISSPMFVRLCHTTGFL